MLSTPDMGSVSNTVTCLVWNFSMLWALLAVEGRYQLSGAGHH